MRLFPQREQNWEPAGAGSPQDGHAAGAELGASGLKLFPQLVQNWESAETGSPQDGQVPGAAPLARSRAGMSRPHSRQMRASSWFSVWQ
jgi:hypothetical protein